MVQNIDPVTDYIDPWYKILTLVTNYIDQWTQKLKSEAVRKPVPPSSKKIIFFGRAKFLCNFRRLFEVLGVLGKEYNSIPTDDVNRAIIGNVAIHVVHLVTYVGSAATSGGQCKWHFMFGTSILVLVLEPVQEWCSV